MNNVLFGFAIAWLTLICAAIIRSIYVHCYNEGTPIKALIGALIMFLTVASGYVIAWYSFQPK